MTPLYPQKLALTSPTGGGRSVGIVRSRTKATEFSLTLVCLVTEYLGAVYLKCLRSADGISATVACVGFAFVITYRKEIVILLCLTRCALQKRAASGYTNPALVLPGTLFLSLYL